MKEQSASGILGTAIEKIKDLVDVSTIIGTPIETGGVTVIPVSKVAYGFASGGSDFPAKAGSDIFGGGGGAGITITPVAFIVVSNGEVSIKHIAAADSSVERLVGMIPDIAAKIADTVDKLRTRGDLVDEEITD
jgi:sporulation protein YtfJ